MRFVRLSRTALALGLGATSLTACVGGGGDRPTLPSAGYVSAQDRPSEEYIIGPLDQLNIFVWRNADLSGKFQVRPDGRITTPLVNDMPAAGKTPAQLAADLKQAFSQYVNNPIVSVIVDNFSGTNSQQIRIVGATEKPAAIPYRANMTLLDAMIAVGGLGQYAAGNRAKLIRYDRATGHQKEYQLKVADLLKHGDSSANVGLAPGDVIIIPESMF